MTICVLDDDLLLPPVLSVILKMYKYRSSYSCLVILPFSVSNIQKCYISEVYIFASQAYNAGSRKTSHVDVRSKPATWIQTGSRYNDIYSVASESPRGVLQCHKNSSLIPLLTMRFFGGNRAGGHLTLLPPPVAGIRVNCFAYVWLIDYSSIITIMIIVLSCFVSEILQVFCFLFHQNFGGVPLVQCVY